MPPTFQITNANAASEEAVKLLPAAEVRQYLELILRLYERIRHDPEAYARFHRLTDSDGTVA